MRVVNSPIPRNFNTADKITEGAKDIANAAKSGGKFQMDTVKDLKVLMTALKNTPLTRQQNESVKQSITSLANTLQSHKNTSAPKAFATKLASINNFAKEINKDAAQASKTYDTNLGYATKLQAYTKNY